MTPAGPPVVLAEDIQGALASSEGGLICWSSTGDVLFASPDADRIDHTVRGRGQRLAWVGPAPAGVVAIEAGGVARYASRSAAAAVEDVPVQTHCAMVTADESMLAVSRRDGVDLLGLPSLGRIARWQADGRVQLHGVTRDHRFIVSTPDGSVATLALERPTAS